MSDDFFIQRGSVLEASDAADSDNFGYGVALSSDGEVLVVSAANWESSGTNRGGVYIYDSVTYATLFTADWSSYITFRRDWQASYLFKVGAEIYPQTGNGSHSCYKAQVSGTTGTEAPGWGGGNVTDGTITWEYIGIVGTGAALETV